MLESEHSATSAAALVVFVVPHRSGAAILESAKAAHAISRFILFGRGTATKEIWDRLGITKDREIVLCVTMYSRVETLMNAIVEKLDMKKQGNGFAFAVSIDKFIGKGLEKHILEKARAASAVHPGLDEEIMEEIKSKVEKMKSHFSEEKKKAHEQCGQELVVVRMANGYGQEVMDCARKAGAIGGTILHGRSSLDSTAVKFFNITIEPETDILFMLVSKDVADSVLEAVAREWGPHTAAHAFGFVVPVLRTFTSYE